MKYISEYCDHIDKAINELSRLMHNSVSDYKSQRDPEVLIVVPVIRSTTPRLVEGLSLSVRDLRNKDEMEGWGG